MKNKISHTSFEQLLLDSVQDVSFTKENGKITILSSAFLEATMPVFKGHFPGQPILPAVLQLTFIRLLCSEALHSKLDNVSVGKTKFSGIIKPEENIKILINLSVHRKEFVAVFEFSNGKKLASSGTVTYKKSK